MLTRHLGSAVAIVAAAALVPGCGSSLSRSTSTAVATSTARPKAATSMGVTSGAVNPKQRESLPPGDIPDTIAYVPFTDRKLGLTISAPEGWARFTAGGTLTFTDKLNAINVSTRRAARASTPASARTVELPGISRSVPSFVLESIDVVARRAGTAVRLAYLGDSRPDPVTGKVGTLAFERYDFFHRGREIVVLVASPRGSDNVDPWRIVTNSVRYLR